MYLQSDHVPVSAGGLPLPTFAIPRSRNVAEANAVRFTDQAMYIHAVLQNADPPRPNNTHRCLSIHPFCVRPMQETQASDRSTVAALAFTSRGFPFKRPYSGDRFSGSYASSKAVRNQVGGCPTPAS